MRLLAGPTSPHSSASTQSSRRAAWLAGAGIVVAMAAGVARCWLPEQAGWALIAVVVIGLVVTLWGLVLLYRANENHLRRGDRSPGG